MAEWLLVQTMPRRQLVLLGASAGWMLPTAWLAQFEEVHAWDIDPLAAPLFRWRHGRHLQSQGTRLQLHTGNGLAGVHGDRRRTNLVATNRCHQPLAGPPDRTGVACWHPGATHRLAFQARLCALA